MDQRALLSLSEAIATVGSNTGRARLRAYLDSQPFPHFEAHPDLPGVFIRIDVDGKQTEGKFTGKQFVPLEK
jgi:hypothetical protein